MAALGPPMSRLDLSGRPATAPRLYARTISKSRVELGSGIDTCGVADSARDGCVANAD